MGQNTRMIQTATDEKTGVTRVVMDAETESRRKNVTMKVMSNFAYMRFITKGSIEYMETKMFQYMNDEDLEKAIKIMNEIKVAKK